MKLSGSEIFIYYLSIWAIYLYIHLREIPRDCDAISRDADKYDKNLYPCFFLKIWCWASWTFFSQFQVRDWLGHRSIGWLGLFRLQKLQQSREDKYDSIWSGVRGLVFLSHPSTLCPRVPATARPHQLLPFPGWRNSNIPIYSSPGLIQLEFLYSYWKLMYTWYTAM